MKTKTPPDSPFKEQLRRITWLVGDDRDEGEYVGDVVHLVQNYVTTTNRTISELEKKLALAEAEAKRWKDAHYDATHRT
jgi:hypothetical protein